MHYKRYKLEISFPAIAATCSFVNGLAFINWYYFTSYNGRFIISMSVPTLVINLIALLSLTAITYIFFKWTSRYW